MLIETAISNSRQKPISRSLVRFGNIYIPQMPVPTLITRPKLILNAEPLVAIYIYAGAGGAF